MLVPLDEMELDDIAERLKVKEKDCFEIAQYKKDHLENDIVGSINEEEINEIANNIINSPAECKKSVNRRTKASEGMRGIINKESVKAVMVIGAAVTLLTLLISNLPAVALAGMGYLFGKEQMKKGR